MGADHARRAETTWPVWLGLVLSALLNACGYVESGEWTDDPRNVERAWGITLPEDVTLERSWYWRAPHFTVEEAYYFQFSPQPELRRSFVDANGFVPADAALFDRAMTFRNGAPDWFAPRDHTLYEAWSESKNARQSHRWVLEDRESGRWFVYACQL